MAAPERGTLRKGDAMLLYTDGQAHPDAYTAYRMLAPQAVNGMGQTCPLADFRSTPVDAVAGLARPEAFFSMLRAQGLNLVQTHALPDHDRFENWTPTATGRPLLCTEKDAVKLWLHQPQAWAVPLQLEAQTAFWQAIEVWLVQQGLPAAVHPAG